MATVKPSDVPCTAFDQEEDDGTVIAAKDTGDYCELTVQGDTLTVSTGGDGNQFMIVATRKK